jgi:hypothetical protein
VIVIAACAALVVVGVVLVVRWGGRPSAAAAEPGVAGWLRYGGAALAAGVVAGVLAAGAGGRLVMRLLAIASPDAQGSLTEAGEFVGEITVDGTLGFILFAGLPAGVLSGLLYALVRPLVGPGRLGGLALGALLLVLAATRIDPLRSENIDFALLDAGWLAVLAFVALGLFHGLVVAAVGARYAQPPAIGARGIVAGRVGVAVVALVALPGFASSVADIVG